MATLTLTDLIVEVADEVNRDSDDDLLAIRRCIERTTDRANRLLRARWMLCRSTGPVSITVNDGDEYLDLADDFAGLSEARFIDGAGTATDLKYVAHREAADRYQECRQGVPAYYSIYENQIRLLPAPNLSGTLEIWTYERFGLVEDTDTNWLLKYHRDVYINGAAYFMMRRLRFSREAAEYEAAFLSGIKEVRISSSFDEGGGGRGEGPEYF
jgi:hypothetical protein